jgi:hypothetical protein
MVWAQGVCCRGQRGHGVAPTARGASACDLQGVPQAQLEWVLTQAQSLTVVVYPLAGHRGMVQSVGTLLPPPLRAKGPARPFHEQVLGSAVTLESSQAGASRTA